MTIEEKNDAFVFQNKKMKEFATFAKQLHWSPELESFVWYSIFNNNHLVVQGENSLMRTVKPLRRKMTYSPNRGP